MPEPINNHFDEFKTIIPTLPPGAIAEFGVYEGGSTEQLLTFGRTVYAFDSFEGMPKDGYDPTLDNNNPPGKFTPQFDIETKLKSLGVITIKGPFETSLPNYEPDERFAFAYIDCDWYSSHVTCLAWLTKHLVPGAALLFDD